MESKYPCFWGEENFPWPVYFSLKCFSVKQNILQSIYVNLWFLLIGSSISSMWGQRLGGLAGNCFVAGKKDYFKEMIIISVENCSSQTHSTSQTCRKNKVVGFCSQTNEPMIVCWWLYILQVWISKIIWVNAGWDRAAATQN